MERGREFVAAIAETHTNGGFTKAIRSIAARRGEPWLETRANRARLATEIAAILVLTATMMTWITLTLTKKTAMAAAASLRTR